jgi:hypothetical protein
MVGDDADAAGPAKELPPVVEHVPDAVPAMPPPSKSIVETAVGDADIPVLKEVPAIELPEVAPAVAVPVPDIVGGLPKDACGSEPPIPEHCVTVPIVDVPSIGLTPGVLSSVAPMGMPVAATGEPGPMPSGEVGLRLGTGLAVPPTCANTGPQPKTAASVAANNAGRIVISISLTSESGRLVDAACGERGSPAASTTAQPGVCAPGSNNALLSQNGRGADEMFGGIFVCHDLLPRSNVELALSYSL